MLVFASHPNDLDAQAERLPLGGYPVISTRLPVFTAALLRALELGDRQRVFFANTNFVVECQALRSRMHAPGVAIVNDGIGMDLAALLVHRRRFAENLNGTDLIPRLCQSSGRPLRFFLLGGKPGVGEAAARTLEDVHGQRVVGVCDGYAQMRAQGEGLVDTINAAAPDVLLVALGNPIQERWILEHSAALQVPLAFGVGALLDFLSGNARRAPRWVQKLHMEWAYRLLHEPRRLIKRYSVDLLTFFGVCLRAAGADRKD
ncbi:WecB/TagA/CpsF family glycosyltransferase [Pseudoxanthomonas sp. X-1]|uniref:WecB/TagA/CpsF family glycosyltransferase n=1 Tax=Pseudoxanthomonas sp. X-1 TaxID=2571115 RepID=UPI00110B1EEA|nr:WecB/TagA/CpsF family glycosyltransferase [Pseudoxanthomonas sp. X-1]TMN17638.1 WecB/TagA/CpsF family glycosyltransferase [Pseudoxanthomonas sp. X-1]UAY75970.1 WecB/TagA/CpsF family glycosyltransferase [Pseudoxanthomonas sp. X-1]